MIVQDIVTRVRRRFGDEAAVQISNDDIVRWINDAQIEIVKNNDTALEKTSYVNLVANQAQYDLPVDFLVLRSLRYKYSDMESYRLLRYKSMQQFDEEVDGWDGIELSGSNPLYFTMSEGKLILFPIPEQSSTNGLKVLYNYKPADVVNLSDALSLPLLYHNAIDTYCMWQASLLDEDHEPAVMYRSNFQNDLDVLKNTEIKDPVATYPVITILELDL